MPNSHVKRDYSATGKNKTPNEAQLIKLIRGDSDQQRNSVEVVLLETEYGIELLIKYI